MNGRAVAGKTPAIQQWSLFPKNLNVFRDEVEGNISLEKGPRKIEIRGKQNSLFPAVVICYIAKQNKSKFWKTSWDSSDNIRPPLITYWTAVNISRVTVNCFPFDVIVFAMLPAQGIWRWTVSLLDVMWPWTSQWLGGLGRCLKLGQ